MLIFFLNKNKINPASRTSIIDERTVLLLRKKTETNAVNDIQNTKNENIGLLSDFVDNLQSSQKKYYTDKTLCYYTDSGQVQTTESSFLDSIWEGNDCENRKCL